MRRPTSLPFRTAAVAAVAVLACGGGIAGAKSPSYPAAAITPRATAAVTPLPLSPAGKVSVLSANIAELLNGADIAQTGDVDHFAYRVQAILSALNDRNPAVPNYAPDLVLLQESTKQSAQNAANFLTSRLGYSYVVGVTSNSGTAAWTVNSDGSLRTPTETSMGEEQETAILYNASTMNAPSIISSQGLGYNKSEVNTDAIDPKTGKPYYGTSSWVGLRQAIALISEKAGAHKQFAVASLHYRPNGMIKSPDGYKGSWTKVVKDRLRTLAPGATPIVGGDLNMTPCYVPNPDPTKLWDGYSNCTPGATTPSQMWTAFTSQTSVPATPTQYAPAYHPAFDTGIDHILTTMNVLSANYDYDYKHYYPNTTDPTKVNYFETKEDFANCDAEWSKGAGDSATAAAIKGCQVRYYSDHEFHWAILG